MNKLFTAVRYGSLEEELLRKSIIRGHLSWCPHFWKVETAVRSVVLSSWLLRKPGFLFLAIHSPRLRFCGGSAKSEWNVTIFLLCPFSLRNERHGSQNHQRLWNKNGDQNPTASSIPQGPLSKHETYNKTKHITKYKTGVEEENKESRKIISKDSGLKSPISRL